MLWVPHRFLDRVVRHLRDTFQDKRERVEMRYNTFTHELTEHLVTVNSTWTQPQFRDVFTAEGIGFMWDEPHQRYWKYQPNRWCNPHCNSPLSTRAAHLEYGNGSMHASMHINGGAPTGLGLSALG